MDFETWTTFVLASSALMLIPGPAMLFMIGIAMNEGFNRALTAVPGLALGLVTSISISLLGAGAVLLASAQLFTILKLAGAAYLIYLGIRLWFSKPVEQNDENLGDVRLKRLFWPAFLVAVLNPKALVLYIAFLPQFVDGTRVVLPQLVILGATFSLIALLSAVACAMAGSGMRQAVKSTKSLRVLNKCGAGAMVASGVLTASTARN